MRARLGGIEKREIRSGADVFSRTWSCLAIEATVTGIELFNLVKGVRPLSASPDSKFREALSSGLSSIPHTHHSIY